MITLTDVQNFLSFNSELFVGQVFESVDDSIVAIHLDSKGFILQTEYSDFNVKLRFVFYAENHLAFVLINDTAYHLDEPGQLNNLLNYIEMNYSNNLEYIPVKPNKWRKIPSNFEPSWRYSTNKKPA